MSQAQSPWNVFRSLNTLISALIVAAVGATWVLNISHDINKGNAAHVLLGWVFVFALVSGLSNLVGSLLTLPFIDEKISAIGLGVMIGGNFLLVLSGVLAYAAWNSGIS